MDNDSQVIRIGISSCLLGEKVRYDGNHKHDRYITATLGRHLHFVPFCPEVAIGMGIPREPIRLEGDAAAPRAVGVRDRSLDVTIALQMYGSKVVDKIQEFSGYIFKSRSPSCGMERVKVYQAQGVPTHGRGVFAATLMEALPLLPVEEEGRLADPVLRENFLERVFVYHRWQQLLREPLTAKRLVEFHTQHKLIVMSHGTEYYRAIGRLVATAGVQPIELLQQAYIEALMTALKHPATPRRHTNVLHHLMGYLKKQLDSADKAELLELIEQYRVGLLPRSVPLTLLRHHFRRHPHPYVSGQLYLTPPPLEMMVRDIT